MLGARGPPRANNSGRGGSAKFGLSSTLQSWLVVPAYCYGKGQHAGNMLHQGSRPLLGDLLALALIVNHKLYDTII
jgi:hypothetical protein